MVVKPSFFLYKFLKVVKYFFLGKNLLTSKQLYITTCFQG